jgi:two-component system sensor histidine kinase CpxA
MRSLFAKILVWFWFSLAITVIGSALISALVVNDTDRRAPVGRLVQFQLEEARAAYESGGRPGLQAFVDRIRDVYDAQAILTDDSGRDLLTNADRSDLVRKARLRPRAVFFRVAPTMVARAAEDGKFWFFFVVNRANIGSWFITPEHLWVIAVAVLLCYWLAFHLTQPVRLLQKAVERFGHGDFSARVGSDRGDELGQLARTFDRMADRIETLLAAERRLLLDISHELRSPLARLGVAVELARMGDDPDAQLNRIQKESDRLNTLVGELLQVTRAEGDPSSLRAEAVRLDQLVKQLVDDAAIEAEARGTAVTVAETLPVTMQGDPELLRRALENVIRNAIRYSPPDMPVEVSLARRNGHAVVSVRDHGPGVPEDALPRIFDAFYRVESDRNRASGGAGLGLSIARRAIELHRGSIRARNAHPGLCVEMELPATLPVSEPLYSPVA